MHTSFCTLPTHHCLRCFVLPRSSGPPCHCLITMALSRAASRAMSTATAGKKVSVLGAAGGIGQPLSLLLKEHGLVSDLSLFDIVNTPGVAADLGHINTGAKVSSCGVWRKAWLCTCTCLSLYCPSCRCMAGRLTYGRAASATYSARFRHPQP